MVRICHRDYKWGGLVENGRVLPSCGSEHSEDTTLPDSQIPRPLHRREAGLSKDFPLA